MQSGILGAETILHEKLFSFSAVREDVTTLVDCGLQVSTTNLGKVVEKQKKLKMVQF